MQRVKIVHSADLHFDTPFKEVSIEQSKINKEELKEVFMKIIHLCYEKHVDIFLLAGDIFDNYTLNRETIYFLEKAFQKIPKTKVFISPGNHDPYGQKSFYSLVNWPQNVHIFKGYLEKVYLKELDVNVWGAGFNDRYLKESLLKDFSEASDKINLMVIHGDIVEGNQKNEYNPITAEQIKNSGMDYIALGHRHEFSGINKSGSTFYAYSGCPQGRGFDELLDKGIIYGFISKSVAELEFIKTSKRNYYQKEIDVSSAYGYEELRDRIVTSIDAEKRKNNFYKLVLVGEIAEDFNIDETILAEKLKKDFYFCKIVDKTIVKYDFDELSKGYSVKSIFVKKMIKKIEDTDNEEEKEVIKLALKLGLRSLSESEIKADDY